MEDRRRISVIGLGKLGTPMAAAMAAKGYIVTGADKSLQAVTAIQKGQSPRPMAEEPGLSNLLATGCDNLTATANTATAVMLSDVTFIIVPTPSGDDGAFVNDYVLGACVDIAEGLAVKDAWHLVVLTSTVMPGSSGAIIKALESKGAKHGVDFGYCYSPLFIALGNVLAGFLRPDMVLVGAADKLAGAELVGLYGELCENDPQIVLTDPLTAELAKLLLNCFLTTKITFANTIGWIAHRAGARAADITRLIGLDRRVSPKFFSAGPPFGGPCFPRDNVALTAFLNEQSLPTCFPLCVDDLNFYGAKRLAEVASENAGAGGKIAVLGMSYKIGSPIMDDSPSAVVVELLLARGHAIAMTDPWLDEQTPEKAIEGADAVIIMHRNADYTCLDFEPGQVIIDPWGIFQAPPPGTHLVQIGGKP